MREVNADQLAQLWQDLGIVPGSVVMSHSFLPSLGRPVPDAQIVVDTLVDAIGPEGAFVVPTFSHSYFRDEVYVVEESPCKVGLLGELVRKDPRSVRSLDPLFSMAAIGRDAEWLMHRESIYCFGPGSIYEKLLKENPYVLLIGVDFTALSLFMHLEKINGVRYRYDKTFTGTTSHQGRTFEDKAVHLVRYLAMNVVTHRSRIGNVIDQEPDCKRIAFGYGEHRLVPAATIARLVKERLAKDPFYLIKDPVDLTKEYDHA